MVMVAARGTYVSGCFIFRVKCGFNLFCFCQFKYHVSFSSSKWDSFSDRDLDFLMEKVSSISTAIRGLKKSHDLKAKVLPEVTIRILPSSSVSIAELEQLRDTIQTLSQCGTITFAREEVNLDQEEDNKLKYSKANLDHDLEVSLRIEGHLDLGKELQKIGEQEARLNKKMSKLTEKVSKPIYKHRAEDSEKQRDSAAISELNARLVNLEKERERICELESKSKIS